MVFFSVLGSFFFGFFYVKNPPGTFMIKIGLNKSIAERFPDSRFRCLPHLSDRLPDARYRYLPRLFERLPDARFRYHACSRGLQMQGLDTYHTCP